MTVLALIAILVVVQIAAGILVLLSGGSHLTGPDRAKALNDARLSVGQLLVGVGLVGGLIYSARTFWLSKGTQWAERFEKASDQLASADLSVRTAALKSLTAIAEENAQYWPAVDQVVSAYLRKSCPLSLRGSSGKKVEADVQLALEILGGDAALRRQRRPGDPLLDLSDLDLVEANLGDLVMDRVRLSNSVMVKADLRDAKLRGAILNGVIATSVNVSGARLEGADLSRADFSESNFRQSVLDGAECEGTVFANCKNLMPAQLADVSGTYSV